MKVTYREYCMALRALQDKFDRRITITDLGGTLDAPVISLGVNWASIGAVPAEEAVAGFLRWQYEECHPLLSGWTLKEEA